MHKYELVLMKIRPTEEEKKQSQKLARAIINDINKEGYEAILVGSRARGTFISGERDLDIFVFFAKNTPRKELERQGLALGKRILRKHKPIVHYAEHPYVKGKMNGITVEIVPCYKVKKTIISSVDRTPLHNDYLMRKIKGKEDEILLLKKFLKAIDAYGADQRVHGFSGVLCEVLILHLHYGTFEKLIKDAAKWDKKTIIDIAKLCDKRQYLKFPEPFVVIDPVDKNRNMAAAVSRTTLSRFILACRDFNEKKPEKSFFPKPKIINLKTAIKGKNLIIVTFGKPDVIEEVLWSQLERLAAAMKKQMIVNGFEVYKTMHWTDEKKRCALVFELNSYTVSEKEKHKGPEVWDTENVKKFIEKNPEYWVSRSRLYAWKARRYTDIVKLIKDTLQSEIVPSHLSKVVQKNKLLKDKAVKKQKSILNEYFKWG